MPLRPFVFGLQEITGAGRSRVRLALTSIFALVSHSLHKILLLRGGTMMTTGGPCTCCRLLSEDVSPWQNLNRSGLGECLAMQTCKQFGTTTRRTERKALLGKIGLATWAWGWSDPILCRNTKTKWQLPGVGNLIACWVSPRPFRTPSHLPNWKGMRSD